MPFCDHCGERYREVWRNGRLRPLLYSNNQPHSCAGSRQERKEAMQNTHGGNWGKKGKRRKFKQKPVAGNAPHAPHWTAADKANKEADSRLRHLLEAA